MVESDIPKFLKMPKPLERYTKEEIQLDFFKKRISEITTLIQGRREVKLFLTLCIWMQIGQPKTIKELNMKMSKFNEDSLESIQISELKSKLEIFGEKINHQYLPPELFEFFNRNFEKISEANHAEYFLVKPYYAKLVIQISLYLNNPLAEPWIFLRDVFEIPKPFESIQEMVEQNLHLADALLSFDSAEVIKLFISFFEYLAIKFSGIQEHFLKISATLFWLSRLETVYSLEIYELLADMFGEHKLETRSSQLFDSGQSENDLIIAEKKGKNKNRAIIYFGLRPGAEWIISGFFPDRRLIIQQQAIAISFLRYSKDLLTTPWKINPMNFNYLMDIWFRSFLYSDNLDQMVYEKAKEHRRILERKNTEKDSNSEF
jgi:hypothetical protein